MKRLVVLFSSLALGAGLVSMAGAHAGNSIAVCCAWNSELGDGVLTYRISGGGSQIQSVIEAAIEEWQTAVNARPGLLNTLTLNKVSGPANIEVRFKRGGGVLQGLAIRRFEKIGNNLFIQSGRVTISGMFAGTANDDTTVKIIAEQEFGHTLGIDHANFAGDVMTQNLNDAVEGVGDCDADAVIAANQWYLVDDAADPAPPSVDHVHCT